jgi:hypothetical protein
LAFARHRRNRQGLAGAEGVALLSGLVLKECLDGNVVVGSVFLPSKRRISGSTANGNHSVVRWSLTLGGVPPFDQ